MARMPTGQEITTTGTPSIVAGLFGRSSNVPAAGKITVPDPFGTGAASRGSALIVSKLIGAPVTNGFAIGDQNTATGEWGINLPFGDSTVYVAIGTGTMNQAGRTWGRTEVWMLTNGPAGGNLWADGVRVATMAEATRAAVTTSWGIGQHSTETTTSNAAEVSLFVTWSREVTSGEVASLTADPYAMFRGA